jgi:xylulokinase
MLIGLDIGTTGCKATILDRKGTILETDYQEYPVIHPQPGYDELNSERVWQSVLKVISSQD